MEPTVSLTQRVKDKLITPELQARVHRELGRVFPLARLINVHDLIVGFSRDHLRKMVLAVEIQGRTPRGQPTGGNGSDRFHTHVVKLGARDAVVSDFLGWRECAQSRHLSQRMFVSVRLHDLGGIRNPRAAVVYQDASQWYGMLTPQEEEVATLHWAIAKSVLGNDVCLESVDRVIRQVLRELHRDFYVTARVDARGAEAFYRRKLRLDGPQTVVERWREAEPWEMRRDVVWLLCGQHPPDCPTPPTYHDPCDFVLWALRQRRVPETLVGPSHGDLHARNIIVGVSDHDVEFPLLIDYGDMTRRNVIAWDFAKLEMEIKVRLLADVFSQEGAGRALWDRVRDPGLQTFVATWRRRRGSSDDPLAHRTQQILFAAECERQLNEYTAALFQEPQSASPSVVRDVTPLDRAMCLLKRIRYEAANALGRLPSRLARWSDEYYFALTVYGLSTAKFGEDAYRPFHRVFALVSGGMAAARLRSVCPDFASMLKEARTPRKPYPSYCVPLCYAYNRWKKNDKLEAGERLLNGCAADFDYAVPLRREHALLLARRAQEAARKARVAQAMNLWQRALDILERISLQYGDPSRLFPDEILRICRLFNEIEVLSRLGRIHKDRADFEWEREAVAFEDLEKYPASQSYRGAFQYYYAAFQLKEDHYPGGNAAVTALLSGDRRMARSIARQVARMCRMRVPANQAPNDRYWVLATEGDMALIRGDAEGAAGFFRSAFSVLPPNSEGLVKGSYDQLCRLYRVLGRAAVKPVLDVFKRASRFKLTPGPLGDCGGTFTDRPNR